MTPHNVEILIDRQMRRWDLQHVPEGPPSRGRCPLPHWWGNVRAFTYSSPVGPV